MAWVIRLGLPSGLQLVPDVCLVLGKWRQVKCFHFKYLYGPSFVHRGNLMPKQKKRFPSKHGVFLLSVNFMNSSHKTVLISHKQIKKTILFPQHTFILRIVKVSGGCACRKLTGNCHWPSLKSKGCYVKSSHAGMNMWCMICMILWMQYGNNSSE